MASKSLRKSRKAQRQRRKRQKEQQRKKGGRRSENLRHRQRLARQTPRAWPGEMPEDVAVFEDSVRESLPAELAEQAAAVRTAVRNACALRGEEALEQVAKISRHSPFSPWRLFIRGLVAWLADEMEAAREAWKRLDPQRRPGRIATVMLATLRDDLEQVRVEKSASQLHPPPVAASGDQLDAQLLYAAKLLRRMRIDRVAIRVAEKAVRIPEEQSELVLGPKKIKWLQEFAEAYRATEPQLVAALEQVALARAFTQDFGDLFDKARQAFAGPRHDRRNLLLSYFYHVRFDNGQQAADSYLDKYLTADLPQNEELSPPLREAIASQIYLYEAQRLLQPSEPEMLLGFSPSTGGETRTIKQLLQKSVQAYPANRLAYQEHVKWIESRLDDDRLTKPQRKPLESQLVKVMQCWSQALPDDVEPRLWLVDYLLENEHVEQAKPHVDRLAGTRQEDPRVRAAPWKWQLLEAMRLSRRKAWLAEVPERLAAAEAQWPSWLSRQWLAYLHAAWSLRRGDQEQFRQRREQIHAAAGRPRDSLVDACMMLGAAQRMRVPAADLKPLRAPVDAAVKKIRQLSDDELLDVSPFFWDLQRTGLLYPAYRMHGGKLAKELFARFKTRPDRVLRDTDDQRLQAAMLWFSEHRFWSDGYQLQLPAWYATLEQQPMFAAARVNAILKLYRHWSSEGYQELGDTLREAAKVQSDPYYRYWFAALADKLDETLASASAGPFGFGFNPFRDLFAAAFDGSEDDDDYEDDDYEKGALDFDPDCDCPHCRAARRAYEASR